MQKKKIKLLSIIIIIAFAVLLVGGVFCGRYYTSQKKEAEKVEKEKEAQADKEKAKAAEKNADQDDIEEPATTEKEQTVEEPADTDFVICNAKTRTTRIFALTRMGAIYPKTDGTC